MNKSICFKVLCKRLGTPDQPTYFVDFSEKMQIQAMQQTTQTSKITFSININAHLL